MTFDELTTLVRREVIVDDYDDAFTDGDIHAVLWRASVEIAAAFDFPRAIDQVAVSEGATSVSVPKRCRKVHAVLINGDDLRPAEVAELLRWGGGVRPSRYFNFDPRRADGLRVAPPSPAGVAVIEFTSALVRPDPFGAGEAWGGLLSDFHALVAYRAGVALFQMEERASEAAYWANEYQQRAGELAAFLGRTEVGNLMIEPALRNDQGAAS